MTEHLSECSGLVSLGWLKYTDVFQRNVPVDQHEFPMFRTLSDVTIASPKKLKYLFACHGHKNS